MTELPPDHQIGANQPPATDPFIERLEGDNEALLDRALDLELARGKLPKEVTSDEDVAAITAWVVRARALYRDFEAARVAAKEPYLKRGQEIDGWFGTQKNTLTTDAKSVEQRSAAYLVAKAAKAEAAAAAAAKKAEDERLAREAAAAKAAEAQREAARKRQEAEEALRQAKTQEEAAQAEEELREAVHEASVTTTRADMADESLRLASLEEDRADRQAQRAEAGGATAAGGGGNAGVRMAPNYRILSMPRLLQSLGPLGQYLDQETVKAAAYKWAKAAQKNASIRGDIPGVEFFETPEVKTNATRGPR